MKENISENGGVRCTVISDEGEVQRKSCNLETEMTGSGKWSHIMEYQENQGIVALSFASEYLDQILYTLAHLKNLVLLVVFHL